MEYNQPQPQRLEDGILYRIDRADLINAKYQDSPHFAFEFGQFIFYTSFQAASDNAGKDNVVSIYPFGHPEANILIPKVDDELPF